MTNHLKTGEIISKKRTAVWSRITIGVTTMTDTIGDLCQTEFAMIS